MNFKGTRHHANCLKGVSGKVIVDEKGIKGVHGKADE